ncbi:MAG: ABC transporter ATP-binding protein [Clostridia bacterium]|nr:ABC transporter ATP-binding protein [Clostridia bacterium]
MRKPMKKAKKGTMTRLLKYFFSSYKLPLVFVLICMVFNTLAGVCPGIFQQTILENVDKALDMIAGGATTESAAERFFPAITSAVLILVGIYTLGLIANFIYQRTMAVITQSFLNKLRNEMFGKMQKLPIKYFDTHTHGDIMSHYTNDIDTLRQLVAQSIPQLIISTITLVSVFFLMLYYSLWMTLIVLLGVVAMAIVTKFVGGGSAKYFVKQQKSLGKAEGYVEEMINGQKVVKVFCHEEKSIEGFNKLNDQLCDDSTKANSYANILMPIMNNIGHILYALIIFVGGVLVLININNISISGKPLDISTLIPFIGFSKQFTMNISQLSQQVNSIAMGLAGADRIFELMDEEPEVDNGYVTLVNATENEDGELTESESRTGIWAWKHPHEDGSITYTRVRGDVRMTEVDFGYVEDKIVLHDITLYAKPGQKIAFVGATGAGKTTITNLINRFYDIADGKIRYDGININKIKKDDLRASLGIVLQDVNLFTGTVMENIRYGKLDATDEECIDAAKRANAHSFISMLPDGYNTVLSGNGSGLSQGQRQLISIARAAVADPPVMILDEATSSIDTRTEAIVSAGMDALMQGRTVFVIAHRLSTIKNSNVIMVLDKGRIIERGSHDDLIAAKGKYYQLYTGSFDFDE